MSFQRYCATDADTLAAGEAFAAVLRPGDVVLLSGPLGAGKTTFAQGVAKGLGVRDRVTSPTFTMVRPHLCDNGQGIAVLHHADVYRAGSLSEVLDLAIGELVEESAVALVEWGELAAPLFGREVLVVRFQLDEDEGRWLRVEGDLASERAEDLERWQSG